MHDIDIDRGTITDDHGREVLLASKWLEAKRRKRDITFLKELEIFYSGQFLNIQQMVAYRKGKNENHKKTF